MATKLYRLENPKTKPELYWYHDTEMYHELMILQDEFKELLEDLDDLDALEHNINTIIIPQHNSLYYFKEGQGTLDLEVDKLSTPFLTGHIDKRWRTYGEEHLNYGIKLLSSSLAKKRLY